MTKDAVFLLQQEVKQMRQDLVKETAEIAIAVAEDMLKKKLTPSDHERLADEYLSELIAKSPRSVMPPRAGGAS
jgi:F-type H+-transporting ATPase subunit b